MLHLTHIPHSTILWLDNAVTEYARLNSLVKQKTYLSVLILIVQLMIHKEEFKNNNKQEFPSSAIFKIFSWDPGPLNKSDFDCV